MGVFKAGNHTRQLVSWTSKILHCKEFDRWDSLMTRGKCGRQSASSLDISASHWCKCINGWIRQPKTIKEIIIIWIRNVCLVSVMYCKCKSNAVKLLECHWHKYCSECRCLFEEFRELLYLISRLTILAKWNIMISMHEQTFFTIMRFLHKLCFKSISCSKQSKNWDQRKGAELRIKALMNYVLGVPPVMIEIQMRISKYIH